MVLFRKNKAIAIVLLTSFCCEIFYPNIALALTGGPTQPEVGSFAPIGADDMVDPFTGDFKYNIPLMDIGGYPINLGYNSGINNDQEASWTGLGWNLNPGAITRDMRGLPDDFKGEDMGISYTRKDDATFGLNLSVGNLEIFGGTLPINLSLGLGLTYNTYRGAGLSLSLSPSINVLSGSAGSLNAGVGIRISGQDGVDVSPNLSYSSDTKAKAKGALHPTAGLSIGFPYNSRSGLGAMTLDVSAGVSGKSDKKGSDGKNVMVNDNYFGGSANIVSFAAPSYTPSAQANMSNFNAALGFKAGAEIFGQQASLGLSGTVAMQQVKDEYRSGRSYGYLYAHARNIGGDKDSQNPNVMDINREKDGVMNKYINNLGLCYSTYDLYSVSGQGMGGMFRVFRNDIGATFDPYTTNSSVGFDLGGIDLSGGNLMQTGLNISVMTGEGYEGKWTDQNAALSALNFKDKVGDRASSYLKITGEQVNDDDLFFEQVGGFEPVRFTIDHKRANRTIVNPQGASKDFVNTKSKTKTPRVQQITYLTADEANKLGTQTKFFTQDNSGNYIEQTFQRVTADRKGHHISMITVTRPDGTRYVYGLPAYNKGTDEVTFATNKADAGGEGTVGIDGDDRPRNGNGNDHFYQKNSTQPYAYAYQLTAILSPDYVDLKGDGYSDDDLGTYTKFNYVLHSDSYDWGTPYVGANLNKSLNCDPIDNKANYVKGTKEIWYLRSIETRTHVALFETSKRDDGLGRTGVNKPSSVSDINTQRKLDKVSLFAKPEFNRAKVAGTVIVPIKSAHFVYDYSLCPNVSNALAGVGGKLTLKSLYFTYGLSKRGKYSPYTFYYADTNHDGVQDTNYPYVLGQNDRWGNYRPNSSNPQVPKNNEFPFVNQSDLKSTLDNYVSAWSLTSIKLPSGATIEINYEADDYAYVQNKKAMSMFRVVGIGTGLDESTPSTDLYSSNVNQFVYVDITSDPNIQSGEHMKFRDAYLRNADGSYISDLYFKFFTYMGNTINGISSAASPNPTLSDGKQYFGHEYLPGYFEINAGESRVINSGNKKYGCIKVNNISEKDTPHHPVSFAAYQFLKINLMTRYRNPSGPDLSAGGKQILSALKGILDETKSLFTGYLAELKGDGVGSTFAPEFSMVRLIEPSRNRGNGSLVGKVGGGQRVKSVFIRDNWNTMAKKSNPSSKQITNTYGQTYDYTMIDPASGKKISSGVAQFEPMFGAEENPFRMPIKYEYKKVLAADDKYYQETPFGESAFPAPTVGYAKVTVTSFKPSAPNKTITKHGSGKIVHEFYTARDFPTVLNRTTADNKIRDPEPLSSLIGQVKASFTSSQGFVIVNNNMHGVQKAQWVYAEGSKDPISGVEYVYQTKNPSPTSTQVLLDSYVKTVDKTGQIRREMIGVDHDVTVDVRQSYTSSAANGAELNLMGFLIGIIPAAIPTVFPKISRSESDFRSIVVTKVINQTGILKETIQHDLGNRSVVENLLYDRESGQVLLTKSTNDFEDPIFAFNYPAYWVYDLMGPSSYNEGHSTTSFNVSNLSRDVFVAGDELLLSGSSSTKAWVMEDGGVLKAMNVNGQVVSGTFSSAKVIRSGRRNMTSVMVGSISGNSSPVNASGDKLLLAQPANDSELKAYLANVTIAQASEFGQKWPIYCNCKTDIAQAQEFELLNPYLNGSLGSWRPKKTYVFLGDRTQTLENNNLNIRKDGILKQFTPFWVYLNGAWRATTSERWVSASEVTIYTPKGQEVENKDPLNRYSSALHGFADLLPIALSGNAQYQEIANDHFEDYDFYSTCGSDHFSFRYLIAPGKPILSTSKNHTGNTSLMLPSNQSYEVIKSVQKCVE